MTQNILFSKNDRGLNRLRHHLWARQTLIWLLVCTMLMLNGVPGKAQGNYPEPKDGGDIHDFASVLTSEDTTNIKTILADLRKQHNLEVAVVTISAMQAYNTTDTTIEAFATNLFNTWGIGNSEKNDGLLLLVSITDRKVRIEVGSGYDSSQNAAMQEVINEHIIPSFRQGDFSQGIYRGTRAIAGELTGTWPADLTAAANASSPPSATSASSSNTQSSARITSLLPEINPFAWIGGAAAAIGAAGYGSKQYLRYRKRRCPKCQTYLNRLDEVADDVYLDSGQKLEEILKSVDYDAWQCPHCNYHTLYNYPVWFSSHKRCPGCSYRTLKIQSETVTQPTYSSSGQERITSNCSHCTYKKTDYATIPMLTRSDENNSSSSSSWSSSSSSGSSYSGGSSSGGGASGSW